MLCYLNGQWIDYSAARIPPWDYGFAMGVCVTEQLRTFQHRLVHLEWNVERLFGGLEILQLDLGLSREQVIDLVREVVAKNTIELPDGHDLGVGIAITPGPLLRFAPVSDPQHAQPSVFIYGLPIPFHLWADQYQTGVSLAIAQTREIPADCVPRQLKCRSRMHYYLAEQEAAAKFPGSRALLLDGDGNVAEATTATVVMVEQGTIVVPPAAAILPGTSLRQLLELANAEKIPVAREPIAPQRLKSADEVFWLSTSVAMLPVTQIDHQPVGLAKPGPLYQRLLSAWSQRVGIDISGQARQHAASLKS